MDVKLIYVALTARVGSSGNVIFENVDAGKHTLTVIARDGQDRASEKGVCVLACMHACMQVIPTSWVTHRGLYTSWVTHRGLYKSWNK